MRSLWKLMICGWSQAKSFVSYHDMACHTWALSGNQRSAKRTHQRYERQMDEFGAHFGYGFELGGLPLVDVRRQCVDSLLDLCDERAHLTTNEVYLCGGFRQGQVCPEHLWLEDHTSGTTYDTFIQRSIVVLDRVGNENGSFQPGCEGAEFEANEIARVRIDGFTAGQFESINSHSVAADP